MAEHLRILHLRILHLRILYRGILPKIWFGTPESEPTGGFVSRPKSTSA